MSQNNNNKTEKILIIGPSWVGDMVMAQSLFKVLVERYPGATIDVMAPNWSKSLLERMPEVSGALEMPLGHGQLQIGLRKKLGRSLKSNAYTQAYVLPNSLKSALVPFFAKIPKRIGYIGELRWGLLNDARKLHKKQLTKTVQRFVALAMEKGTVPTEWPYPRLEIDSNLVQTAVVKHQLTTERPILAICPGAEYGPAKRWPESHCAAVAKEKIQQGWQVWIFGSEKDQQVGQEIQQLTGEHCEDLTGKTSMAEALDLMSLAQVVVSNDSGLMHVAAALDKPVVALYGSSDPKFTPPLHDEAKILTLNLECSPCFKRECPLGHLDCLNNLTPDMVLALLPDEA